jgi:hypothetical protein
MILWLVIFVISFFITHVVDKKRFYNGQTKGSRVFDGSIVFILTNASFIILYSGIESFLCKSECAWIFIGTAFVSVFVIPAGLFVVVLSLLLKK